MTPGVEAGSGALAGGVHRPDPCSPAWRKSSYSNQAGGNCVEVAGGVPGVVPVRDSKAPAGPVLGFAAPAWTAFVGEMKKSRR
ncbi:DUF397 domain-containing protein [Streptomyces calidiresistens]|uniref:DUF397 domain-containing protein n=1 Tax=Streptomyces calidiresistens TaxID=1485586 RepID=A0A7W3XYE2_9ACTN|nr:DUF397 domain-containing protein [Streptomyces calidiresistens]MBB0231757.1 DUF397 domain-containing protein [Streptomyces calidiresistens]